MMRLVTIFIFLATVLFCGCGGGSRPAPGSSTLAPPTAPEASEPQTVFSNWQFTASSTVPGKPPLTFPGSIGWAGTSVSGALHLDGSNCFDQLTTIVFPGTMTAGSTSLTSAAIDGQVITITGNFSDDTFTGTYKINGGCADGNHGELTGFNVWDIGSDLSGTFTNSAQKTFSMAGKMAQSALASSDGSFPITGTATFDTPCFKAGIIHPGTFPTGSWILGMSVALQIETSNGILTFVGTLDQSGGGWVNGIYTVSGGGCDDSGTAVLQVRGKWDY